MSRIDLKMWNEVAMQLAGGREPLLTVAVLDEHILLLRAMLYRGSSRVGFSADYLRHQPARRQRSDREVGKRAS